jgi:hypothetical protein
MAGDGHDDSRHKELKNFWCSTLTVLDNRPAHDLEPSTSVLGRIKCGPSNCVSADLKGSQFSRFRGEPQSLPVVAEHTNAAAAVEDKLWLAN